MELTTHIDIPKATDGIAHDHRLLALGSCFADEMGERMRADKFDVMVNPFGVLYNPASIAALLLRALSERPYTTDSPELFSKGELWHSWMHHSSFSAPTREALLQKMNATMAAVGQRLREADWLIVTFGSSYVYRLQATDMLVANCHKQPDALFVRSRMAAYDIVDQWTPLLQLLRSVNPRLKVLFTVSPIRHRRDGLHENQLSKAELLLAVDGLTKHAHASFLHYFPSYEILLDELRDYRFYADDLVHPSRMATDYVYERFCNTFVSPDEQAISRQCREIAAAVAHKPFNPESNAHRQFVERVLQKINQIKTAHPSLDFDAEIELCNIQLNK